MRGWRDPVLGVGLILQLTITVVVAALFPLLLGIWLDRLLNTSPFLTLVATVLGVTLGSIAVHRRVNDIYKRAGGNKS